MAQDMTLLERVREVLTPYLSDTKEWVIAVSGGKDSMTLLHILLQLKKELVIAHLDHGLREESAGDAEFVKSSAASLQLPFETERVKIRGSEMAAREARYLFLRRVKEEHGASCIVTAHTQDDQAETVLMHLARGSGLTGLCGMSVREGDLLRPLLTTSRTEIEAYVHERQLAFCHDKTNDDTRFTRNFVRHEIVPRLTQVNAGFVKHAQELSDDAHDVLSLIHTLADKWVDEQYQQSTFHRAAFVAMHPVLQREIILSLYAELYGSRIESNRLLVERARKQILEGKTGTRLPFGSRYWLIVDSHTVTFEEQDREMQATHPVMLTIPGTALWHGSSITAAKCDEILYTPDTAALDALKLPSALIVRSWRTGDRFVPSGSAGTRKLSDFFTDQKIPARFRSQIPVVATPDNEIVWVGGYRVSEVFRATAATSNRIQLSLVTNEIATQ